ncbi:MAG TPA: hypothetical protein VFL04_02705 [Rectinemataceae bacterium]|nr:hypothetical protein [Rectinemataceae bacterium]
MYAFLVLGLPLGFLLLYIGIYPREEAIPTRRAYLRGLVASIPVYLVARLLGAIVPSVYGSPLFALHEWAARFLPFAGLPVLLYLAFYHFGERLGPGSLERRLTAFHAGALSPIGLYEMVRIWGSPNPYDVLIFPFLLAATALALPRIAISVDGSYGFGLVLRVAGAALASLAISICPTLILARLWPLIWLVAAAAGAGAWFFARGGLEARAPVSLSE